LHFEGSFPRQKSRTVTSPDLPSQKPPHRIARPKAPVACLEKSGSDNAPACHREAILPEQ
jgi:hypothetical protein